MPIEIDLETSTILIRDLAEFIRDPKCAEMQGDGVPCDNVSTACEQCAHFAAMLESMDRIGSSTL